MNLVLFLSRPFVFIILIKKWNRNQKEVRQKGNKKLSKEGDAQR
jgi:hypothetical protein